MIDEEDKNYFRFKYRKLIDYFPHKYLATKLRDIVYELMREQKNIQIDKFTQHLQCVAEGSKLLSNVDQLHIPLLFCSSAILVCICKTFF
jgi:hypothetical protein